MMELKSSGTFPKGRFDGPENKNVNQQILAGVQSTDGVTPVSTIKAAEEKERYTKYMTVDYMSSEQSMSESEGTNSENGYENPDVERPKKKVFSVSTLPWRSPELTQVMHSLDKK
ncbi:unnamed protein product [Porites lobata]|uniref:Uncharacterized protein n=1 Tax=Porites lobata TaxID=104759 RepID=A0ABN8R1Y5_9CNID|nr:unnamed protein product [Porites lobata]